MRKVKTKNYVLLAILVVITMGAVLYMANWYKMINTLKSDESVMKKVISEIKVDDLENYMIENPNIVLYVTNGTDESIKSFEKSFKDLIQKKDLTKEIVFLDADDADENQLNTALQNLLVEDLKNKNVNVSIIPNLYIIRDSSIIDSLYKVETKILKSDVVQFLEIYEEIEP